MAKKTPTLTYQADEKTLFIKDGLRRNYLLLYLLMGLNLFNSCLNISRYYYSDEGEGSVLLWLWIVLGVVSLVILIYLFARKSSKEKLGIDEIRGWKIKKVLGNEVYYLALQNGKQRDLSSFKAPTSKEQMKRVLTESGLPRL